MAKLGETNLFWEDAVVIAIYFAMVLAVGFWSSIRSKRDSVAGYFLASRNMHWIPVGASLFASNIGSGHFIGLAGSGAKSGIGIAGFELNAIFVLLILGWVFIPVYMASGVYTMPEYLRKRFGGQRIRIYLSVLALLLYVFTKISVFFLLPALVLFIYMYNSNYAQADLYAGAIFINQSIKLDMYGSIVALLAIASLFTIAGGLSAVIWTDFVQTILMLLGAFTLMVLSFVRVGGYQNLIENFKYSEPNQTHIGYNIKNESCSAPPDNYMSLLRSPSDPELPWTGMIFGLTISAVWYWCSDQVIVQRALSAKDLSHAKAGCILAGYLKLLPMFLLVFPGMASRVLFPDDVGCSDPDACERICGSKLGCTNIAYPKLVLELMPAGARGLMMSVMLAALMSSLTSIFNSSSTIFTMDIWTRIRKQASETELLIVGRVFVLFLVVVSIIWIPIVQAAQNSQLFHYIQSVTSYLAPPVCSVYVLAILSKRINEKGAFWGLMVGLVVGLIRFGWEFSYSVPPCTSDLPDPRPSIISQVHYLHFGIILFFVSSFVTIGVSLLTEPIAKQHLYRLTVWNRYSKEIRVDITSKSVNNNVVSISTGQVNVAFQNGDDETKTPEGVENFVQQENEANAFNKTSPPESPKAIITVQLAFSEDDIEKAERETAEKNLYSSKHTLKDLNSSKHALEDLNSNPKRPLWKTVLFFVCGVNDKTTRDQTELERPSAEVEASTASDVIIERPLWKRICNANALILLIVGSFVWGFYA